MKKIITAVAAVAMATTMFAADVAATVKLAGSLFNLDKDKNVSALKVADDATESYKAAVALSVSGDKAGASVKYANKTTKMYVAPSKDDAAKLAETSVLALAKVDHSIWFAPVDALKITLGNSDKAINQEKIDWSNSDTNIAGYGFKADVTVDAFNASVMLYPGEGAAWFAGKTVAQTVLNCGFSGDWGTVGVMVDYEHPQLAGWANAKNGIAIGAGYSGAVDATGYFVNAIGYIADGAFTNVRGEVYVSTAIESLGLSVFLPMNYIVKGSDAWATCGNRWHKGGIAYTGAKKDGQFILGTVAKVTYPVASMNASLYVACNDWLEIAGNADAAVNVKPGLTGSCGIMGWEAYIDMKFAKDFFTLEVPFVATINF